MDYSDIPTVVFSHPTIGTVGLTEREAEAEYGRDALKVLTSHPRVEAVVAGSHGHRHHTKVYESTFVNLQYGPYTIPPADKPRSHIKLICHGEDERVVGLHIIGDGADEMLQVRASATKAFVSDLLVARTQGFGVAVKMGATKADLDRCVAIHPTAAEEVVTLAPWGLRE